MNNLFVVVEGTDNVGKSTLIKGIQNYYNDLTIHTLHYSNIKQTSSEKVIEYSKKLYNEMFKIMHSHLKYSMSGFICDRSHLGEMVYGPIYRNYSGEYILDIERRYKSSKDFWNNLYLITLYDDPENLIKRDDGLSFSTDLEIKKREIELFKQAHEKSLIKNKLLLNIKENNKEQTLKSSVEFIGK